MNRRRVLVFNHFATPLGSPGGTRHVEMFNRLDGWTPTIVAADRNLLTGGRPRGDDVSFVSVRTTPYRGNGWQRVLNWVSYAVTAIWFGLWSPRPDVVYASSPHLLAGLAGWLVAALRRAAFVLEIRDLWPRILVEMGSMSERHLVYRLLRALELFLYRRADAIVVMATGSVRALVADGVPQQRLHLIPNGADPDDFVSDREPATVRAQLGLGTDRFVLAYTGAHGPANGLDLVLDAAAQIAVSDPDVLFLLVGDGPAKPALVERAQREGLSNVMFRDPVPKRQIPDLLAAVDVGLHVLADVPLFRYGISPNKLFDYMAAGLPVLTNVPGEVGDLVTQTGAGLAVQPDQIAAGARQLRATDTARLNQYGESGRDYIAAHQSRAVLAQRLQALLDEVADER